MNKKEAVAISFNENFPLFPSFRLLKEHGKISLMMIGILLFIIIGDCIMYRHLLQNTIHHCR
jgi:hypothetical protein